MIHKAVFYQISMKKDKWLHKKLTNPAKKGTKLKRKITVKI
jgi:hypothetical protein